MTITANYEAITHKINMKIKRRITGRKQFKWMDLMKIAQDCKMYVLIKILTEW